MIRLTGINSGMDTEAMISELVSAQSYKKTKLVKQQKKLSWKQDTWKTLNSKIFSFHQKTLSDMRFSDAYQKKKTVSSNDKIASVISSAGATDGVQTMKVESLAKAGYLTGAKLSEDGSVKSSTKLSELTGNNDPVSFSITTGGKTTDISLNGSSTIQDVVNQLKNTGINANFDEKNQRMFLSAKSTGTQSDFALTANTQSGFDTLTKLGINVLDSETKKHYEKYANMTADERQQMIDDEVAKRVESYEKALAAANENITKMDQSVSDFLSDPENAGLVSSLGLDGTQDSAALGALKTTLEDNKKALETVPNGETAEEKTAREEKLAAVQKDIEKLTTYTGYVTSKEGSALAKADAESYLENDAAKIKNEVTSFVDDRIAQATQALTGTGFSATGSDGAVRIEGKDAKITLNGAEFTSDTNTFSINNMTITALAESNEEITLTTNTDFDSVYDTIKNFIKEYNTLINEISTLYGADSADKYEPLTTEEKKAMSDDEVEEWEKKIKDSILRKDSTLGGIQDAMSQAMMQGFEIGGKKLYLSNFGINTGSYFDTTYKDRYSLHIDGDKDDEKGALSEDKLKTMIASEPENVMRFFQELSDSLYKTLQDKMGKTKLSSAMTFYNDVELKDEIKSYEEKISEQERKLNEYEDKWYSKFSKMEVAMAKMQSKQNALSGFFG